MFVYREEFNKVMLSAWFPAHASLGILGKYFSLCFIRSEDFACHGLRVIQVTFAAGGHTSFVDDWLLFSHYLSLIVEMLQ